MKRLLICLAAMSVLLAAVACGRENTSSGATSATIASDVSAAATSDAVELGAFPVTIPTKFGDITVASEPQRVVSLGYTDQDFLLALGVTPIAIRDWYGDQPFGTWPWAQDELGAAEPKLLSSTDLNFEQIAALQPDLIVAVSAGLTDTDYETLSKMAPTLAQPGDYIDYGTPWDVATTLIGEAVGKGAQAAAIVESVEGLYAAARAEHPEFLGATAAVAFNFDGMPGAYASSDSRSRIISDLGFTIPATFDELAGDQFYFSVSEEELAVLDADVVAWIVGDAAGVATVRDMALRPTMRAFREGREMITSVELAGAFSFGSPLSIEFVLEALVPELALAVDGDPATIVPSALEIGRSNGQSAVPTDTGESDAAAAFSAVFDSTIEFAEKADHLQDADALRATVESYTTAGSSMGGISLKPTATEVEGDTATITYDVLFGAVTAYTAQIGTVTKVGEVWVVSATEFCAFMASARNSCPA